MTELITINPEEFGLDKTEAQQVKSVFVPMIEKMEDLEKEYNEVIKLEPNKINCAKAKELGNKFMKVRTGTAEIHKKAKAYYLNGGRAVDAFKNVVTFAIQGKEAELEKLEKHFEIQEQKRIEELQKIRSEELAKFAYFNTTDIGKMSEEAYIIFVKGVEKNYNDQIEAEKKAEEERLEKERLEKEEQERIRKENEKLKQEAEAREKQLEIERAEARKKQEELEKKAREEAEAREKLEAENKRKIEEEQEKQRQLEEEQERLSKESAYKMFLKDNEGNFDKIIKEDGKVVLYKKVAEFII